MTALVNERQNQMAEREKALDTERARAVNLARDVDNLKDLIAKLEQGLDPAARDAREAARSDNRPALSAFRDPGRLAPAVAFASLRGQVPIPVNGVKLKDFGAPDGSGGAEKGLSIATRAGAQVTAPADGWVVYSGPFRSYGQLLILNVGGGYHDRNVLHLTAGDWAAATSSLVAADLNAQRTQFELGRFRACHAPISAE